MAERVGFSKAVCYSSRAFNKMPETVVLTASLGCITQGTLATQETLINPNWAAYGMDGMDSIFAVTPQATSHHNTHYASQSTSESPSLHNPKSF